MFAPVIASIVIDFRYCKVARPLGELKVLAKSWEIFSSCSFDRGYPSTPKCLDVWVCTSRVMGKADFAFLRLQGLLPNGGPVIHRIGENDQRPCGELKLAKLRGYAAGMGITWAQFAHDSIMFDDSLDVQKTLRGAGIRVIDPVQFNTYIARKIA